MIQILFFWFKQTKKCQREGYGECLTENKQALSSLCGKTAETIEKYLVQISQYFLNHTTSGVMEGINNKIELIIRQSYGFNTFDSLRKKLYS